MASKYVEVYKEIYNGSGAVSDRVRMAMEHYSVPLSFTTKIVEYKSNSCSNWPNAVPITNALFLFFDSLLSLFFILFMIYKYTATLTT